MKRLWMAIAFLSIALLAGCGQRPANYDISGRVTQKGTDIGIPSVSIKFSQSGSVATTDEGGRWDMSGLSGTNTIAPAKDGWVFVPSSKIVRGAISGLEFSGTYSASGIVKRSDNGEGVFGVSISADDSSKAVTNTDGHWSSSGFTGSTVLKPEKQGWSFTPSTVTIEGPTKDIAFVGTPLPADISYLGGSATGYQAGGCYGVAGYSYCAFVRTVSFTLMLRNYGGISGTVSATLYGQNDTNKYEFFSTTIDVPADNLDHDYTFEAPPSANGIDPENIEKYHITSFYVDLGDLGEFDLPFDGYMAR